LIERAAQLWEVEAAEVSVADGVFRHDGHSLTFKELAAKLGDSGSPIMASTTVQFVSPAALANAIGRAIGVRLNVLPMSPARILEALWAKQGTS
jgi:CO/xanthine dehydrogenase Mo-binding subunit